MYNFLWKKKKNYNKYAHLVQYSPWPIFSSMFFFCIVLSSVYWWHTNFKFLVLNSMMLGLVLSLFWWLDVNNENYSGFHKLFMSKGLRIGMMLFILSEICFFGCFFWGLFHKSINPDFEMGCFWPPFFFFDMIMDPFSVPLFNSLLLLSSGVYITLCHHSILVKNKFVSMLSLFFTVFFGLWFLYIQMLEYSKSWFSVKSSVYGTVFFLLTGFHGFHVTMGCCCLLVCLLRLVKNKFSSEHHVGFECTAWYWHFVDVVWLFLFFCVYLGF